MLRTIVYGVGIVVSTILWVVGTVTLVKCWKNKRAARRARKEEQAKTTTTTREEAAA